MQVEALPGTTNVVRFPVELRARPTLELVHELAPDSRDVASAAAAFGLSMPGDDLRDVVDEATAEHILNQLPATQPERDVMLGAILEPALAAAIAACRRAREASGNVAGAKRRLAEAVGSGVTETVALRGRVDARALQAAESLVAASTRAEEACGVWRAVHIALRCEPWSPRNHHDETVRLIAWREERLFLR